MGITKYLEKLENFFCASGVSTSNYGVVRHYLLSDPIQRELYPVKLLRGVAEAAAKRLRPGGVDGEVDKAIPRIASTLRPDHPAIRPRDGRAVSQGRRVRRWRGSSEPLTFVDAQKLASGWFSADSRLQALRSWRRQRRSSLSAPCFESWATLPRKWNNWSVCNTQQESRMLQLQLILSIGSLDHLSRRCPNKRQRGHRQPTGAQNVRSGDYREADSLASVSGLLHYLSLLIDMLVLVFIRCQQNNREPGQKVYAGAKIVALILKLRLLHQPRQTVRYKHLLDLESPLTFIHTSHCLSIRGCSSRIAGADSLSISSL
ncbi:hypothetical protein T03_313 [Trichinella britovi]|uniref:Uncharacterized protein n=1 Tax=Trichinella britovi TaxID=45882 RepID=A0A0V1CAN7_TRIBR|nr:hypothetical protein T03_313 [Trichinella britovi]